MTTTVASTFNWFDYVIILIIVISTLVSLMRGFISEAISLFIWLVALLVAFKFTYQLSYLLGDFIKTPTPRLIASFVILFIAVLIVGAIANHFLSVLINSTGLTGTNRILGMVFGFARGVLLIAIFILFAQFTSLNKVSWWSSSHLIPYFQDVAYWLKGSIPAQANNLSHYLQQSSSSQSGSQ